MPIHEYAHNAQQKLQCTHTEDVMYKMSDEVPKEIECPMCNKILLKQISSTSFSLRGGGWYADGYTNKRKQ